MTFAHRKQKLAGDINMTITFSGGLDTHIVDMRWPISPFDYWLGEPSCCKYTSHDKQAEIPYEGYKRR